MSDAATGILHGEGTALGAAGVVPEPAAPSVIDGAAARVAKRDANLKKAQAASAAKRKRGRPLGSKTKPAAAPAPASDDPISAAVKKELLAAPVTCAKDLAQLFATVEISLGAVAPLAGEKGVFLVRALQWSDGNGKPSPQASMAAGFMWPWLEKQDVFGKLAASADGLMFAAGCTVLLAPLLSTIAQLFARRPVVVDAAKAAPEPPREAPPAQSHPLAVVQS